MMKFALCWILLFVAGVTADKSLSPEDLTLPVRSVSLRSLCERIATNVCHAVCNQFQI